MSRRALASHEGYGLQPVYETALQAAEKLAQEVGGGFNRRMSPIKSSRALAVKFQEVVVHSIKNCEADVAKQKHSQEIEWTITIMLD